MKEQYGGVVARHYASFRPALHGSILARTISDVEAFPVGLDIGCGTGYSAIALAKYCDKVFGIDPSEAMLADATRHPKVNYTLGTADDLSGVPFLPVNIITLAGSLHYAKSDKLRQQLNQVCCPGATIVVYDFEIRLDQVLASMNMNIPAVASDYDHAASLVDWKEFPASTRETGQLRLELSAKELGHVLLADSNRFESISKKLQLRDPYPSLVRQLERRRDVHGLDVDIYFARHEFSPPPPP
ncbi:MAG: class I SAM-dependent methyltransferase [Planctomycetota bacterium]